MRASRPDFGPDELAAWVEAAASAVEKRHPQQFHHRELAENPTFHCLMGRAARRSRKLDSASKGPLFRDEFFRDWLRHAPAKRLDAAEGMLGCALATFRDAPDLFKPGLATFFQGAFRAWLWLMPFGWLAAFGIIQPLVNARSVPGAINHAAQLAALIYLFFLTRRAFRPFAEARSLRGPLRSLARSASLKDEAQQFGQFIVEAWLACIAIPTIFALWFLLFTLIGALLELLGFPVGPRFERWVGLWWLEIGWACCLPVVRYLGEARLERRLRSLELRIERFREAAA